MSLLSAHYRTQHHPSPYDHDHGQYDDDMGVAAPRPIKRPVTIAYDIAEFAGDPDEETRNRNLLRSLVPGALIQVKWWIADWEVVEVDRNAHRVLVTYEGQRSGELREVDVDRITRVRPARGGCP